MRIFEYTPGFVHAKVITADDSTAVVGSVNFDYRSFYLHFECGVYMYGADITAIEEDIRETIERSEEITVENHRRHGFIMKTAGALLKLFAPLM